MAIGEYRIFNLNANDVTNVIGSIFICWVLYMIGAQIYFFLATGVWIPNSLFNLLWSASSSDMKTWLVQPDSWLGVQKIIFMALDFFPRWAFPGFMAGLFFFVGDEYA